VNLITFLTFVKLEKFASIKWFVHIISLNFAIFCLCEIIYT